MERGVRKMGLGVEGGRGGGGGGVSLVEGKMVSR